jgi:thymidylate synthase (FAD)
MKKTKLIWVTPDAENLIVYCARVSNPKNQGNKETSSKLINYLIKQKHWSPFELVNACFEVNTTRAISAQIFRHRSLCGQEFSARYQNVNELDITEIPEVRYQGSSNRQSSLSFEESDGVSESSHFYTRGVVAQALQKSYQAYNQLIDMGVANESARAVLPMSAPTRLYLNGTLRSWIHYLQVRGDEHTQKEHIDIANEIKTQLKNLFPNVFDALENNEN